MTSGTRWCAAACAPFASTILATAAMAHDGRAGQLRVAPQAGDRVVVAEVTLGAADTAAPLAQVRLAPDACAGAGQVPTSRTLGAARAATLCLLNGERALRGLAPLVERAPITRESQAYSELMVEERFFAHDGLAGYLLDGLYWVTGQNLAWGDGPLAAPDRIVEGWMASTDHKANILDPDFGEIGIGIAIGSPEPRSRLQAATYTTDFAAMIREPVAATPTARPKKPTRPARIKRPSKRKACRAPGRARKVAVGGAKRKPISCTRRPAVKVVQWVG
jgi:uncharacterized protein YkwD